ncbi:host attachment protein [Altererythrobacter sp.]|uniref:baeRF12 domain-containing protein n=1 Tax=Altererythrobacter sp. TaxID=1872480 RepID=UPI003D143F5A
MKLPHKAHVAIVDGENFTLYRNEGQIFEPRLAKVESPDLKPTNFSAGVRHQDHLGRMLGRTQLDELAHGAAVATWLNGKAIAGELGDVLIVADPKTLGEMRQHFHPELEKRLTGELAKTLTSKKIPGIEKAIAAA